MAEQTNARRAQATVLKADRAQVAEGDWGELRWYANAQLGNSDAVTVGRCTLRPGRSNPRHHHPNCAEVLVVAKGRIAHTLDGTREVELGEGDTISIPLGMPHQARNIGDVDAELLIVFTSAHREVVGE